MATTPLSETSRGCIVLHSESGKLSGESRWFLAGTVQSNPSVLLGEIYPLEVKMLQF